jgi:hypothetical protein
MTVNPGRHPLIGEAWKKHIYMWLETTERVYNILSFASAHIDVSGE